MEKHCRQLSSLYGLLWSAITSWSVNHRLRGRITTDTCSHCCLCRRKTNSAVLPPTSIPAWAAGLGDTGLKEQRMSYEPCLPSGSRVMLEDGTRLNMAFRYRFLTSTLDVAAHCDGQTGEDRNDFYKLPWPKVWQRKRERSGVQGWEKLCGRSCGSPGSWRRRFEQRVECCAWGWYVLVLQRDNFKAFPASRRVRCGRERLCCLGLCCV